MKYIGAREAAKKWGITSRRATIYCAEGRIDGAYILGNAWAIPEDAEKPTDPRKEKNRIKREQEQKEPKKQG